MKKILFLGDSLTAGYGLASPATQSFPALIQNKIDQAALSYRVLNAGISGDTSGGGLARLSGLLDQPIALFILELGINDFFRGVSPATTFGNLDKIIKIVRKKFPECKIVVMGMEAPFIVNIPMVNEFRQLFRKVAEKHQTTFVPFFLEGVAGINHLNLNDGLHPSAKGYEVISENTWPFIKSLLS